MPQARIGGDGDNIGDQVQADIDGSEDKPHGLHHRNVALRDVIDQILPHAGIDEDHLDDDDADDEVVDDTDEADDDVAVVDDEEESLDVLLAREQGADDLVRLDDEPRDGLVTVIPAIGDDEFTCRSCFLVKRRAQLADADAMYCVDCV